MNFDPRVDAVMRVRPARTIRFLPASLRTALRIAHPARVQMGNVRLLITDLPPHSKPDRGRIRKYPSLFAFAGLEIWLVANAEINHKESNGSAPNNLPPARAGNPPGLLARAPRGTRGI